MFIQLQEPVADYDRIKMQSYSTDYEHAVFVALHIDIMVIHQVEQSVIS